MGAAGIISDEFFDGLPAELAKGADVKIVRYPVEMDGESWEETDPMEFARTVRERKGRPTSAALREADIERAARELVDAGKDPVLIHMSTLMSGPTAENARRAASKAELKLKVVDSRTVVGGGALVELAAIRAASEGKSQEEVVEIAEGTVKRASFICAMQDLMYLYRGGRIGAAKALMGTLFKTLPIVEIRTENAVVTPLGRVRKAADANEKMVEQAGRDIEKLGGKGVRIVVTHTDNRQQADALSQLASAKLPVVEAFVKPTCVVSVVHIGPGAWGMGYEVVV